MSEETWDAAETTKTTEQVRGFEIEKERILKIVIFCSSRQQQQGYD